MSWPGTEGRVARRLALLVETGVVYLDIDLASAAIGFPVSAYLWLTAAPAALEAVCTALASHDEVPFVAAVSGRANIVASLVCRTLDQLYDYVVTRVAALDGVSAYEISPVVHRVKQAGTLLDGDRLAVRT